MDSKSPGACQALWPGSLTSPVHMMWASAWACCDVEQVRKPCCCPVTPLPAPRLVCPAWALVLGEALCFPRSAVANGVQATWGFSVTTTGCEHLTLCLSWKSQGRRGQWVTGFGFLWSKLTLVSGALHFFLQTRQAQVPGPGEFTSACLTEQVCWRPTLNFVCKCLLFPIL